MKRFFIILLILLLAGAWLRCHQAGSGSSPQAATQQPPPVACRQARAYVWSRLAGFAYLSL